MILLNIDKMQALENICKQEIFDSVKAYYKVNSVGTENGPKFGPERPPADS